MLYQSVKGASGPDLMRSTCQSCPPLSRSYKIIYTPALALLCTQEVGTAQWSMGQNIVLRRLQL